MVKRILWEVEGVIMNVKYEEIFKNYKMFIEDNSQYEPNVVKHYSSTTTKFPTVSFVLSNNTDTDFSTICKTEYYEEFYFTIEIYTKDKNGIASQVICDELTELTKYFMGKINMKMTLCKPIPNLDTGVLRKVIQYQSLIGNVRGNIIRR